MHVTNWLITVEAYLSTYENIAQDDMIKFALTYLDGEGSKLFAEECYDHVDKGEY